MDGRPVKILDCSGNQRAEHLVQEWFARSMAVIVVYDMTRPETLDAAITMLPGITKAGARGVLFGSKSWVSDKKPASVDLLQAKDEAARNNCLAIESASLADVVRVTLADVDAGGGKNQTGQAMGAGEGGGGAGWVGRVTTSIAGFFGGDGVDGKNLRVLKPSLKGTKNMRGGRDSIDGVADLRPVQELQDSDSAVTCITFGQENAHKGYILLAAASKDGQVVVYRCYRTEMELQMLPAGLSGPDNPRGEHSNIAIHSRLVGHTRAITSIFFNLLEDSLVTTSIDKSVRFWSVDTGEMLKVFTDSSPVPVAAFLPFNPSVFVAANSNAVLRLVNAMNGQVLQKLKVETEVRALKFDDTGLFLLAGTKNGSIHVLEVSNSSSLKFRFRVNLTRGGVTCITFVPAAHQQPPCLLVNTSDSSVTIIDCIYGPPSGELQNLTVRHRVKVAHSLLPLKCCYSAAGQGFLISGGEDKEVYIYSLAKGANYKMQYLKHHQVPVVV